MNQIVKKVIISLLVFQLFFGRVLVVSSVFSQEMTPPSAPMAPSAPPPPTAPSAPSLPTAPAQPEGSSYTIPASPPVPTAPIFPTSVPLPTYESNSTLNGTQSPTPPSDGQNPSSSQLSDSSSSSVNDPANTNTGAFSNNYASEALNKKLETLNQNLAELNNKVSVMSQTGFNYANLNSLDGKVFSGDSAVSLNLMNKLNSNVTGLGGYSVFNIYNTYVGDLAFSLGNVQPGQSFSNASLNVSKNAVTGPGSTNVADSNNTFLVKEVNGNDAKITNDIALASVTGSNSASMNTGNGIVQTGNASAIANVINLTNTNLNVSNWLFGVVNIFGKLVGNILLPSNTDGAKPKEQPAVTVKNSDTGPGSTNSSSLEDTSLATFTNTNNADIQTTMNVTANSGNNDASYNTGGGAVVTGATDTAVSNSTIANVNKTQKEDVVWMVIVNDMGKWVGTIIGQPWGSSSASNSLPIGSTGPTYVVGNTNTGPLSQNSASYKTTDETQAVNQNDAAIQNNISVNSDTGSNQASYNTGAGVVVTGDAKSGANVVNMANTNVTAKKFIALLVNVIGGEFLGNIIPPEEQSTPSTTWNDTYWSAYKGVNSGNSQLPTFSTVATTPEASQNTTGNQTTNALNANPPVGVGVTNQTSDTNSGGSQSFSYIYTYDYVYVNPPTEYVQAVAQVNTAKKAMGYTPRVSDERVISFKRGLFISPAFAKATESSLSGMLFGGANLRVNNSWLSVVPIAIILFFLRRRKKFPITKYLNALMEVIL